ncbi:MAG TPA: MlaD family protein [Syntrophorhabdaceae bacterium]|nr:MlaD family protein [Syntrophorhabdaceae bacterium]
MSKPASKTLIGVFVIGAIALAVLAVVVFGSGRFFSEKMPLVMYFEGSVAGLNIGSPVMFRGVKVGIVKDIVLRFDAKDVSFLIPVYVELDPKKFLVIGKFTDEEELDRTLINKGLRATLELQSMVTGQLMINLDFHPGKPARIVGFDKRYTEIPTVKSGLEKLLESADDIPLKELFNKLLSAIAGVDKAVNSPKFASSLELVNEGLKDTKRILSKIDNAIDPVIENVKASSGSVREILKKGEDVPAKVGETLLSIQNTLQKAEHALNSIQGIASENSTVVLEVDNTLKEISDTARSLRFLSDYLQRYPESLIWGKKQQKGE